MWCISRVSSANSQELRFSCSCILGCVLISDVALLLVIDLVHKRSNRPNDDHMTLTASSSVSGLKPKHTILYRSFPHRYLHQPVCGGGFTQGISGQGHWTISDDDKQFRPDARMRKMDSMLRRMFDLAEWVCESAIANFICHKSAWS